ncbi:MAG: DUF2905 domain-containing protein [Bacteroidia bacterium]|nr:DUF2905 domain-containing protein [Bacteroidia bacterium]MCX7764328.1 DUF2905 domain-containing protein [Bacteroidia bacterium]MDW8056942.1 DUF2905 domain-containing protein [Bacteroidia bacterium]
MASLGKLLVIAGLSLAGIGGLLWLIGERGLPQMPLDIVIERPGWKLYFPLGTSILISLILSGLLYLFSRLRSG